jgi:nitrogen fixation NifU-like protein
MFNEKVIEHFMNPKNAGEMENPDAEGTIGSPVCGDIMQIFLKIENDIITDVKFKTFGCGSAIASSSIATEMIKGKSVEEALKLSNKDVLAELGGLPSQKEHCSLLSEQAIRKAIYNYAQEHNKEYEGLKDYKPEEADIHCDHGH